MRDAIVRIFAPNTRRIVERECLASDAVQTGHLPRDIAGFLSDPCSSILWGSLVGWANSADEGRRARLRALRQLRQERHAPD